MFDEAIFPFKDLHENAGALLRKEICLLPTNLFPYDQGGVNRDLTANDRNPSDASVADVQENYQEEETEGNGEEIPASRIGSLGIGSGVDRQPSPCMVTHADLPAAAVLTEQNSNSQANPAAVSPIRAASPSPAPVSSTTSIPPAPEDVPPAECGAPTSSGVPSSTAVVPVAPSTSSESDAPQGQQQRPNTRSWSGIVKPKRYTDGTVWYGMLCSTGEPEDLQEALEDKNWRQAMHEEHSALLRNKTWHLVPQEKKGRI